MKKQFQVLTFVLISGLAITFTSCNKKDEMEPPTISFKTGAGYTSANANVTAGNSILIGIEAAKADSEEESEDVLTHFNITKSVNGGTGTSVYDIDVPAANEDDYDYDFNTTAGATVGDTEKYTFTITNRDGLTGQISLTITVQ